MAGVAGVIMLIAGGDVLFEEPVRGPRQQSEAPVAEPKRIASVDAPITGAFERPAPAAQPVPRAEPLAFAPAAAPPQPPPSAAGSRLGLRGYLADEDEAEPASSLESPDPATERASAPAVVPAVSSEGASSQPEVGEMQAPAAGPSDPKEGQASSGLTEEDRAVPFAGTPDVSPASAEGRSEMDPAAPSAIALRGTDPIDTPAETVTRGDASLWSDSAAECPRDWLDEGAPGFDTELSADCEPKLVLVAPVPSADADEPQEEWTLRDALQSAVREREMRLTGFVARLPVARPDPPAQPFRKKARYNRRADWPAEPPPNCGKLHAYWRFVDRKKGTKEWYCR